MANVVHSVGQPLFDWEVLLEDVINNGTLAGGGALVTITFGTTVLRISGAGLAIAGGQLTAGTISGFQLFSGATLVVTENGYITPPTIAQFNALLTVYNDASYNAVFAKEGLTVIGSAAADDLRGSAFNDTINTGDAGPDDGNFVYLSYGTDTVNGGSFYDIISGVDAPINLGAVGVAGITVIHDNTGIGGKGTVTGTFTGPPAGSVNTTFNGIERVIGTNGNDSFFAGTNALNAANYDMNWVGGAGNDRFNDQTDRDLADFRVNYDAEKFEGHGAVGNNDGIWGNAVGEFGVIINLSAAAISVNVGDGLKTVAAGTALDTFRNTDTIVRGQGFKLTDTKDHFVASAIGSRIEARGGDDTLIGSDGRDEFNGNEGNDTINTGDGDDFVNGGLGNDTINAGAGLFDFIRGSNGTDTVNGDVGYDMIAFDGDLGTDTITVTVNNIGPGTGTVTGSLGGVAVSTTFQQMERVRGSFGNDVMQANVGVTNTDDANYGFWFDQGAPRFFDFSGSRGNDTYRDLSTLATGSVVVNYREEKWSRPDYDGHQWGTLAGEFGVIFNMSAIAVAASISNELGAIQNANVLAATARDTFANTDTLVGIRAVNGTETGDAFFAGATGLSVRARQGNDKFTGGIGTDEFRGDEGNDTATGGGGFDRLRGDQGNDNLSGGDGNDNIQGGNDNDILNGDNGNDELSGDNGLDTLNGGAGNDFLGGGSDNDILNGDAGADEIEGGDGIDTINGGAGNDFLYGNSGNDIMNGGSEADELVGDDGTDQLIGGTGADRMFGGLDNDTYTVDNVGDVIFEFVGGGTLDIVLSSVDYNTHAGIERVVLTGVAAINATGRSDTNDIISGNTAANTILGLDGVDTIAGLGGADIIDGGNGGDRITGGLNNDTLTGGLNSDIFTFALGDSGQTDVTKDIITDYTKGLVGVGDKIDFTSAALSIGGSALVATATEASINATTGVASFLAGSGTTLADALLDIATRMTTAGNALGEFAFFKVNNTGNFHMFISDGVAGVTANDTLIQLTNQTAINTINLTAGDITILT